MSRARRLPPGITPHHRGGFRVVASAGAPPNRRRLTRICDGSRDDAIALLAELRDTLDRELAVDSPDSLAGLCRRYVADRARLGRAESYVAEMGRKCDLLASIELGSRPADLVSSEELRAFYARLDRDGLGASGIRAWHALISGALSAGVRWGELAANVAKVGELAPGAPRPKGIAPDPELARRYLDLVESAHPSLGALLRLGALTGARRGELCALRWSDLDVELGTLSIERNATSPKGRRFEEGPTKNRRRRSVPLSPEILAELMGHRARCELLAELAGVEILAGGFIFGREEWPDGSVPFRPDYVTRVSRELAESADLPTSACHPHGLRHYFATQAIRTPGTDVAAVAAVLGQDPEVTLSTYAHAVDESRSAAVAGVGKTLAR